MVMWYRYTIHHIDGIHNHLTDLGSRWCGEITSLAKATVEAYRVVDRDP